MIDDDRELRRLFVEGRVEPEDDRFVADVSAKVARFARVRRVLNLSAAMAIAGAAFVVVPWLVSAMNGIGLWHGPDGDLLAGLPTSPIGWALSGTLGAWLLAKALSIAE